LLVLLVGVLLIYVLNTATKHIQLLRGFTIGSPIPIIKVGTFIIKKLVNNKHKLDIAVAVQTASEH